MLRFIINILLFCLPPSRFFKVRRRLLRSIGIKLAENVNFCGFSWIYGRGTLDIGENTWISPNARIFTNINCDIKIGSNVDIGPFLKIVPGSHEIGTTKRRAGRGLATSVTIGDGVWVGANCLLLGGATIGKGSIIAAGSVVTGKIPSNSLAAGVPAVIKRKLELD